MLHAHCYYTGTVPANDKVDIVITFTPAEYNTATIELKVNHVLPLGTSTCNNYCVCVHVVKMDIHVHVMYIICVYAYTCTCYFHAVGTIPVQLHSFVMYYHWKLLSGISSVSLLNYIFMYTSTVHAHCMSRNTASTCT